tara:strand:+ start:2740 stop:3051 length:312 start_codon:yes stop_codon:yes gene_type:complete
MAKQIIQTNVGVEQEVVVPYGNDTLRFVLQFNDYDAQWFMSLLNENTGVIILSGIYLVLGNDALFGMGLQYGTLTLTDTEPTNPDAINLKADFGARLKLVRDF